MPYIEEILEELRGKTVIVEGKKDLEALRRMNIRNVVAINGKPLIEIVQGLKRRKITEVVILTDFDSEGRKISAKLARLLHSYKISTNSRLRHMFRGLGKTRVEDFNGMYRIKESDSYGEISASINKVLDKSKNKGKRSNRET